MFMKFFTKATFLQMSLVEHLNALLLALASSVDNFTVGLAVGIGRKRLPFWANGLISLINAFGALSSAFGGSLIVSDDLDYATWLAAIAFGTLGIQELAASSSPEGSKSFSAIDLKQVLRLAIPMTLNNLAGGTFQLLVLIYMLLLEVLGRSA